jgi:hypothetical protein
MYDDGIMQIGHKFMAKGGRSPGTTDSGHWLEAIAMLKSQADLSTG